MQSSDQKAVLRMLNEGHLTGSEALVLIRKTLKGQQAAGMGSSEISKTVEFYNWVMNNSASVFPKSCPQKSHQEQIQL